MCLLPSIVGYAIFRHNSEYPTAAAQGVFLASVLQQRCKVFNVPSFHFCC